MTLDMWEKRSEIPLLIFAALFLVSYSWQVLGEPGGNIDAGLEAVNVAVWVIFAVDYGVRLLLAKPRGSWFARNILDFLIVVLPALRPLRLLRLVTLLDVLNRTAGSAVRSRILSFSVGATGLLLYITTVGYGDYAPVTGTGRFVAVGLMVGGVVLVGVIVGTLSSWIVEKVSEGVEEVQEEQQKEIELLRQDIAGLRKFLDPGDGPPPCAK